jgi:transposase
MLIISCDYHPSMQQIAWMDTETGECGEQRLMHRTEAEQFYRDLKGRTSTHRHGGHRTLALTIKICAS